MLTDRLAVRLTASGAELNSDGKGTDDSGGWYAADLLYRINSGRNYLILGADYLDLDSDSSTSAHLGWGMSYPLSQAWALTGEAMGHYELDDSYTDFTVGLGLRYTFGTAVQATAHKRKSTSFHKQQPQDSDADGVTDSFDDCPDTPKGYAVDEKGCTLYRNETITKRLMVNFEHNSAVVATDAMAEIEELAKFMRDYPQLNVVIEGHTSSVGSEVYNQHLSEQRANAVATLLTEQFGIDSSRVAAQGLGETQLLLLGNTQKVHAANRRIMAQLSVDTQVEIRK